MTDLHERLQRWWDLDALTYDDSPSHALGDPVEAACWRAALRRHLPEPPASVLDVGAGTGAIGLLAAELGYDVTALDLSPNMLARANLKAEARGLRIRTIVGPATEPPDGPFDAVVERHLLWTTPDPAAALSAWRRSAPGGRLLLFEAIIGRGSGLVRARDWLAHTIRRGLGTGHDHHAPYDPEILASLPLAGATTLGPLLDAVGAAGWSGVRVERLRDVEWAWRRSAGPVLGWLELVPRFAVLADG
jgi:SAM-dependent methyltransferase